jgi:hypothetical protein
VDEEQRQDVGLPAGQTEAVHLHQNSL